MSEIERLKDIMKNNNDIKTVQEARVKDKELYAKKCINEMFEMWVGREMMEEEYAKYIKIFDSQKGTDKGFNLKGFIIEEGIKRKKENKSKKEEFKRRIDAQKGK